MTTTQLPPPSDPARSILSLTDNDFFRLPIEDDHYNKFARNRTPPWVNDGSSREPSYLERVEFLFERYQYFLGELLKEGPDPDAFFAGTGISFAEGEEHSLKTISNFQKDLMKGILKSIRHLNNGQTGHAYKEFTRAVSKRWKHFSNFISYTEIPADTEFFRMREIREENDDVEPEAMFHVPYSMRYNVGPERFSIAGYPCFYLAESIRVCWEELGKPDFEDSHVARYVTRYPFQLLDLSVPCWSMAGMEGGNNPTTSLSWEDIVRNPSQHAEAYADLIRFGCAYYTHIMLWPLAAACLMHTRISTARFKAEYILPQFLLQMIRDRRLRVPKETSEHPGVRKNLIDGIIFPSTKTHLICKPEYLSSYTGLKNLVLVTDQENPKDDYSRPLARVFNISEPLSLYNFVHYDLATVSAAYQQREKNDSPLAHHAYYSGERTKRYLKLFEKLHWHLSEKGVMELSFP